MRSRRNRCGMHVCVPPARTTLARRLLLVRRRRMSIRIARTRTVVVVVAIITISTLMARVGVTLALALGMRGHRRHVLVCVGMRVVRRRGGIRCLRRPNGQGRVRPRAQRQRQCRCRRERRVRERRGRVWRAHVVMPVVPVVVLTMMVRVVRAVVGRVVGVQPRGFERGRWGEWRGERWSHGQAGFNGHRGGCAGVVVGAVGRWRGRVRAFLRVAAGRACAGRAPARAWGEVDPVAVFTNSTKVKSAPCPKIQASQMQIQVQNSPSTP